jgi:hypothetical protein
VPLLEEDRQLQPGQVGAEAAVGAGAEAVVPDRAAAEVDVQCVGIFGVGGAVKGAISRFGPPAASIRRPAATPEVVPQVGGEHSVEMVTVADQQPVPAFGPDGAHPPLGA